MLRNIYLALGTATCVGYAAMSLMGWEVSSSERNTIPGNVRQSPGGYRSYHFWHSGYHGGK